MNQRVRAIVVYEDGLVMIKRVKPNETYWVLPGGGVEQGESLVEAITREVREETGLVIKVGEQVGEFNFINRAGETQHEYIFTGEVTGGEFGKGDGPEFMDNNDYEGSHEAVLVPLDQVEDINWRRSQAKTITLEALN